MTTVTAIYENGVFRPTEPVSLPEIIATANAAEPKLRALVRRVVGEL